MNPRIYVPIIDGLGLLIFFVIDPLAFAAIGYLAWKGKPRSFDRRKYAIVAVSTFLSSVILIACAKWINADVRTWPYIPQMVFLLGGLLLLGVGFGCGLAVLTYRQQTEGEGLQ